jgi:hypothetical protein
MKINNSLDVAMWEKIPCHCKKDNIEQCYPLKECIHCKSEECWKSVPQENFKVQERISKNGKVIDTKTRIVKEITLVRGKYEDVMGWTF